VILDANVVIKLHELQLWHRVCAKCQVHLAETVVQEVDYYEINAQQIWIDKQALRSECAPFSVTPEQVRCFLSQFDQSYQDRLDLGSSNLLFISLAKEPRPAMCSFAPPILLCGKSWDASTNQITESPWKSYSNSSA